MLIRPSMDKFQAAAKRLEVVGISRYLPAFLNRQIISILYQKSLGVPDRAFQELQVHTSCPLAAGWVWLRWGRAT